MARKFFYIAAGLLMLALSFHFGFTTASAQAPGNSVVAVAENGTMVFTANGDIYQGTNTSNGIPLNWALISNVFGGGPTPALHQSWGQLKSRYATPPSTPGMTVQPGATNK